MQDGPVRRQSSSVIVMLDWLQINQTLLTWLAAVSVVTFVGSLLVVPWLIVRIPADYFSRTEPPVLPWANRHPVVHVVAHVAKNMVGVLLILAGIAMLVLPGQGVLTIVIGILLLDFPGKRALERRLVSQPTILCAINWMRERGGRPPLRIDP